MFLKRLLVVIGFVFSAGFVYSQAEMGAVSEIIKSGLVNKDELEKVAGSMNKDKDATLSAPVIENRKENVDKPSLIEELFPDGSKTSFVKQFGYEIFRQPSTTFAPVDNVPVGSDYIIGPGDTFVVYVWGKLMQETFSLAVDRDGKVSLPKAGTLFLWGMKFSEAEKIIKETLGQTYANFSINVTLGRLRTIRAFVLGEVYKPGGYTISSLSTIFHGLYESGGPTKVGSFRKIKLIRDTKTLSTIDLYDFLLTGEKGQDARLQSGDTIFVPSIGPVVAVRGSVKRPRVYELLGETKLSQVIKMAGGLTPSGYLNRVQIERIVNNEKKSVFDFEVRSLDMLIGGKDITVNDGDMISIFPINKTRFGYVSITGNINMPGEYELTPNLRAKDLLEKARGILPGTFLPRAEISRYRDEKTKEIIAFDMGKLLKGEASENHLLKEWDQIIVYSLSNVVPVQKVQISGAVNKEVTLDLTEKMKISDLIFGAGGLKPTALLENAELFHMVVGEQPEIRKISLKKILIEKNVADDIFLDGGDHLFIREDVSWIRKKTINLAGEIKYPGLYVADYEEKLSSVIERAGGFTQKAYLPGIVFTRGTAKIAQQKAMSNYLERLQTQAFLEKAGATGINVTDAEVKRSKEAVELKEQVAKIFAAIEVPGRLIIKIEDAKTFKDSKYDIIIEDGDALLVPQTPSSINVIGSVYNSSSLVFEPNKNISYFIDKVGGTTKDANRGDVYVIKASGEVEKNNAWGRDVERGDTVVVPAEVTLANNWFKTLMDTSQIFYQIGVGYAAIKR